MKIKWIRKDDGWYTSEDGRYTITKVKDRWRLELMTTEGTAWDELRLLSDAKTMAESWEQDEPPISLMGDTRGWR